MQVVRRATRIEGGGAMTPRIAFITAVGAALVLAVSATAAPSQQQPDFWNYDKSGAKRTDTSPGVAATDLATLVVPSGGESLTTMLDARERALSAGRGIDPSATVAGRARVFAAMEKFVETPRPIREPVVDDRFRIDPTAGSVPVSAATSGREIEWPQIGFGVALGLLLALGATIVFRTARRSQLAH
jgi:hypothetical protein